MEKGKIIKIISNQYDVRLESGETLRCVAMGKLRKRSSPIVGDYVQVERFEGSNGIQRIEERRNELRRPAIANVDQAIIVMSTLIPDYSPLLIDRLIFQICYANIQPILCVTKMDLIDADSWIHRSISEYRASGYTVVESGEGYDESALTALLKDKVSVLTGQSGAGKSSLLNRIEPSFHLHTQQTSKALGRGRHTTRHCELHPVAGGWVADTPGFSSLDFSYMSIDALAACIPDFQPYLGECRFKDCVHLKEPDCAIKQAVAQGKIHAERYRHYRTGTGPLLRKGDEL